MTLSHAEYRPHTDEGASFERIFAYLAFGSLFGIAYPRQRVFALCIILVASVGLEAAQLLTPDRHPRLIDAAIKGGAGILGGVAGMMIAEIADRVRGS